ncbi:MAG: type II toxin-antitoxin system death-on-curing family toxin [Sphingobacteriales bacterium]|nr:MAG: type II toxin-antitoxin system death-on-curing family toxin [Sphingobacteriales bacterium]
MITKEDVLKLHHLSIEKYGGAHGIRDEGLLDSAIARPYQTFGGENVYSTVFEQAAAFAESLIINHPFVDGNKRTGFLVMFALLRINNIILTAAEDSAYDLAINISTGHAKFDEILTWLKNNNQSL